MFKTHTAVLATAALLVAATFPNSLGRARAAGSPSTPWLDTASLKPGAKGYGLTVFSGTEPERFDVEVIGVLKQFLPDQDLILIKTHHPRLEAAKVVAGMSGSPIFIDGKVIGAYSYGWQFGSEPVAGVTPIKNMMNDLARPIPPEYLLPIGSPKAIVEARRSTQDDSAFAYHDPSGVYDLRAHGQQIAAALAGASGSNGPSPVATPLMVGGVGEIGMKLLHDQLGPLGMEPMQGGGSQGVDPDAPDKYVDGGAIAVQMVRGDMSMSGIGTVTRVSGDRFVAFGHPMMQGGVSRLPTAIAKIQWVLASMARSFKMGNPVRPLGALINDRQSAIVVDSKVEPALFSMRVDISGVAGATHPSWNVEAAHERFVAPMIISVVLGNAVDSTMRDRRDVTWNAHTKINIHGHGSITLHDFGVSVGGTPDAMAFMGSRAVRAAGALLNDYWEPVKIDSIETKLDVQFARDLLTLRGIEPIETEIDAGQKAHLRVHLVPYAGPEQVRVIEVDIPSELVGDWAEIEVAAGHQVVPDQARPENLAEMIANLPNMSFAPDVLVATVKLDGQGVAYKGQVATRLPPGALDTIRSTSATVAPEPVPSLVRTIIPINHFVLGRDSVRVKVRPVLR